MTNKSIGPSFASELRAANVTDWRFWWTSDGVITFDQAVAQRDRAVVLGVYESHNPATPAPAVVPQSVTRYQAEVQMRRAGIWGQADTLFAALPDSDERKIAWLRAPTFNRKSPALIYAAQQLGITDEQLDAMFIEADKII